MLKLEANALVRLTSDTSDILEFRRVAQRVLNSLSHKTRSLQDSHILHVMVECESTHEFSINAPPGKRLYLRKQFVIAVKKRKPYTKKVERSLGERVAEAVVGAIT